MNIFLKMYPQMVRHSLHLILYKWMQNNRFFVNSSAWWLSCRVAINIEWFEGLSSQIESQVDKKKFNLSYKFYWFVKLITRTWFYISWKKSDTNIYSKKQEILWLREIILSPCYSNCKSRTKPSKYSQNNLLNSSTKN